MQFGFKPKHGTEHAAFALKSCVDFFTKRGSDVFVAFCDFSKAFDKISHHGLFIKLMERNVPLCFLLIVMFWYMNMEYDCKWGNSRSQRFAVLCGTKQGGILSPDFFSLYINDLIKLLRSSKIGCHVLQQFLACLLFADDMSLLSPSRSALQQLLDICSEYCSKFCLNFNIGKTKVVVFGKSASTLELLAPLHINNVPIDFVKSYRYLGFNILSDSKFKFSSTECLRGFFGAVNSVLTVMKRPSEHVLMQLLYSNCVPKLTYGAAVKDLSATDKHKYNVAVNNAVRRIFGFRQWQSIRQLRDAYQYDSIEMSFAKARKRFLTSIANHSNELLRFLYRTVEVAD